MNRRDTRVCITKHTNLQCLMNKPMPFLHGNNLMLKDISV